MKSLRLLLLAPLLLPGCSAATGNTAPAPSDRAIPANIIVFIADGIGSTHFTVMDRTAGESSALRRFSHSGMVMTHSGDAIVTDSGASASAYATGHKARNRALSIAMDGKPKMTALEIAEQRGFATGLATTSAFFDATLAAFAAHSPTRYEHPQIIEQMMASGVDLVISNGLAAMGSEGRPPVSELGQRHDLVTVTDPAEMASAGDGRLLAVFPSFGENDLDHPDFPLPRITEFSIDRLGAQAERFFVVIETEATDTASHRNETADVLTGLDSLNEAVNVALDFAKQSDTLVILTGDHETGAFQIYEDRESPELALVWGTTGHTGQAIPVFAYGPGAERFTGWLDNTEVGQALIELVSN